MPFLEALLREVTILQASFPDLAGALGRACALLQDGRLFPEDDGRTAMVLGSDGQTWYAVNGACSCKAAQYRTEVCKHRLALRLYQRVADALLAEDEAWTLVNDVSMGQDLPQTAVIPQEHLVTVQGKAFIRFEGLLALAHQHGLVSLETTITQCSFDLCVCQSTARFQDGRTFVDVGDASPANVARHLAPHFIRMAATRASARVLRRALNVSACSVEELGDEAGA